MLNFPAVYVNNVFYYFATIALFFWFFNSAFAFVEKVSILFRSFFCIIFLRIQPILQYSDSFFAFLCSNFEVFQSLNRNLELFILLIDHTFKFIDGVPTLLKSSLQFLRLLGERLQIGLRRIVQTGQIDT